MVTRFSDEIEKEIERLIKEYEEVMAPVNPLSPARAFGAGLRLGIAMGEMERDSKLE